MEQKRDLADVSTDVLSLAMMIMVMKYEYVYKNQSIVSEYCACGEHGKSIIWVINIGCSMRANRNIFS